MWQPNRRPSAVPAARDSYIRTSAASSALLLATFLVVSPLPAQPPEPAALAPPSAPAEGTRAPEVSFIEPGDGERSDPSARRHDGFYFRVGTGLGFVNDSIVNDRAPPGQDRLSVSGLAFPIELMFGGTPVPGFVIGAALWADPIINPTVEMNGKSGVISDQYSVQFSRLGPFIDLYPDATKGFHVLLSAAVGAFSLSNANNEMLANAKGPAVTAGLGYDFWIGEQWSVGLLGRFTYAYLSVDAEQHDMTEPALVTSFTCH